MKNQHQSTFQKEIHIDLQKQSISQKQYLTQKRLINSQYFSIQIAMNYLFQWKDNPTLIILLLHRLLNFSQKQLINHIPTIIFIISLKPNPNYTRFIQKLSRQSLTLYLIIRWSYSTFWQPIIDIVPYQNHLDCAILKGSQETNPDLQADLQDHEKDIITQAVDMKFRISEYAQVIHEFYQRLFKIPQKLKKYDKTNRFRKLKEYLNKIQQKLNQSNNYYHKGVVLPISHPSNIVVRIVIDYCLPFSTKQRVPFKIVFETINPNIEPQDKIEDKQKQKYKKQGMILPHTYFGEEWEVTKQKIHGCSPYKENPSYQLRTYMIKSGDDLRQQYLAMQLIKLIENIIKTENLKLWVKTYDVIPYDHESGLIEFVDNTRTVSYLKEMSGEKSLRTIYHQLFLANVQKAMLNFVQSLAGYSLIQYLLQIKDRHNNNIMIDRQGHIIHIDFSFMISSSPGNMNFEKAPFKLVQDYIDIMEGPQSDLFEHFHMLFFLGLKYIRKYKKEIMSTLNIMTLNPNMKCFMNFNRVKMEYRFHQNCTDQQLQLVVRQIINEAWSSYTTGGYDKYQWLTNSIHS